MGTIDRPDQTSRASVLQIDSDVMFWPQRCVAFQKRTAKDKTPKWENPLELPVSRCTSNKGGSPTPAPVALTLFVLPFLSAVAKDLPTNRAYRFGRYHANQMRRFADSLNLVVRGLNSGRAVREMVSGAYPFPETQSSRKYLRRSR
jgi:hypothetical protein